MTRCVTDLRSASCIPARRFSGFTRDLNEVAPCISELSDIANHPHLFPLSSSWVVLSIDRMIKFSRRPILFVFLTTLSAAMVNRRLFLPYLFCMPFLVMHLRRLDELNKTAFDDDRMRRLKEEANPNDLVGGVVGVSTLPINAAVADGDSDIQEDSCSLEEVASLTCVEEGRKCNPSSNAGGTGGGTNSTHDANSASDGSSNAGNSSSVHMDETEVDLICNPSLCAGGTGGGTNSAHDAEYVLDGSSHTGDSGRAHINEMEISGSSPVTLLPTRLDDDLVPKDPDGSARMVELSLKGTTPIESASAENIASGGEIVLVGKGELHKDNYLQALRPEETALDKVVAATTAPEGMERHRDPGIAVMRDTVAQANNPRKPGIERRVKKVDHAYKNKQGYKKRTKEKRNRKLRDLGLGRTQMSSSLVDRNAMNDGGYSRADIHPAKVEGCMGSSASSSENYVNCVRERYFPPRQKTTVDHVFPNENGQNPFGKPIDLPSKLEPVVKGGNDPLVEKLVSSASTTRPEAIQFPKSGMVVDLPHPEKGSVPDLSGNHYAILDESDSETPAKVVDETQDGIHNSNAEVANASVSYSPNISKIPKMDRVKRTDKGWDSVSSDDDDFMFPEDKPDPPDSEDEDERVKWCRVPSSGKVVQVTTALTEMINKGRKFPLSVDHRLTDEEITKYFELPVRKPKARMTKAVDHMDDFLRIAGFSSAKQYNALKNFHGNRAGQKMIQLEDFESYKAGGMCAEEWDRKLSRWDNAKLNFKNETMNFKSRWVAGHNYFRTNV